MALLGRLTLNDGTMFIVGDYDPTSTGTDAPQGSVFLRRGSANAVYQKIGPAATDWSKLYGSTPASGGAVAIPFTDKDTARRVSVVDALVGASSNIFIGGITRPSLASDAADKGYLYTANIVRRYAGGFDVFVVCLGMSGEDVTNDPPNETVTLSYLVG